MCAVHPTETASAVHFICTRGVPVLGWIMFNQYIPLDALQPTRLLGL
eukprot:SAG11_NODE_2008_length_3927_cov_7.898903_2_plen_47_part_00